MMKKLLAFTLGMVLVLAFCASACAERAYLNQTPIPAQNVKTVQVTETYAVAKGDNPTRLYVRHYLWSTIDGYYGSNKHTNYFQAFNSGASSDRLGGDWMAPDTANYVRSNSIILFNHYGVAARANTKYADAGYPTIQISGYTDGDA